MTITKSKTIPFFLLLLIAVTILSLKTIALAESQTKQLETYLQEAQTLFMLEQPIDARAKLQQALKVAPNDYRPHFMLGAYYLGDVAHFKLAYKYLLNAEELFTKKYGSDIDGTLDKTKWRQHARMLYLLAEARLNLDDYQGALDTLDRFAINYWDTWYPGTRAWVLMKLKRIDEAITAAQSGLLQQSNLAKTYNVLGILLSVKGNSKVALDAFSRSIRQEVSLGGSQQIATPLNNAGEVYREIFQDSKAEAAWVKAVSLPDGCEHILPSLNLSTLLVDELRLFQAERVLSDFEACFANDTVRQDTEHRALLRLGRGKVLLREGKVEAAIKNLRMALERQQWFGKIGTDINDMRLGALVANADALKAYSMVLRDRQTATYVEYLKKQALIPWLEIRSWWLKKQARQLALEKLADFEDLQVRHTDAMIEYPSLSYLLIGYPIASLNSRIKRLIKKDTRVRAHDYYRLFLGVNEIYSGKAEKGLKRIKEAQKGFRKIDRLARAEAIAYSILASRDITWWWNKNSSFYKKERQQILALYKLLPSHVRYFDFALPISLSSSAKSPLGKEIVKDLENRLTKRRFLNCQDTACPKNPYSVHISETKTDKPSLQNTNIVMTLYSPNKKRILVQVKQLIEKHSNKDEVKLINSFIDKVFSHKEDPASKPLPKLEILKGIY